MINETEQGIFDWGLDFLEMQKKNLEAIKEKYSREVEKKTYHNSNTVVRYVC